MFVTALLVALWTAFCTFDAFGPQLSFFRPLLAGSITGLIMGDFATGMIIAAALELMWLGVVAIGAYVPPDVITGSILGTAFGILTGEGAVIGIAVAVPVAIIAQQLDILARTLAVFFTHRADKAAPTGDFDKMTKYHLLCIPMFMLTRALPVFLALLIGAEAVTRAFDNLPPFLIDGLSVGGGMLPALGFGMLLSLMLSKKLWVFFLFGFLLNVFLGLPTMGLAMVGIVFAVLYDTFTRNQGTPVPDPASEGGDDL